MIKIEKLNAAILATIPIFGIYDILPGNSLATLLLIFLLIVNIFSSNVCYKKRTNEIRLFIGILLLSLIGLLLNNSNSYFDAIIWVHNLYPICIFFISLIILTQRIDSIALKKAILIFALAASIIVIFQKIQQISFGSFSNTFFIPGLSLYRDVETMSVSRPSAFFTEPAHLAIYVLPSFYINMMEKRYVFSVLNALGILCSGSSTGFILLAILFIYSIIRSGLKIQKIIAYSVLFSIVIGIIMNLFPNIISHQVERFFDSDIDDSTNLRLFGTIAYLGFFNTAQLIFGIGFNQLADFLQVTGNALVSAYGEDMIANYANAFVFMMISYGIIGEILLIQYIFKVKKQYKPELGFLIILLGILFSDQVLFNMNLLYLLIITIFSSNLIPEVNNPIQN